MTISCHKAYTNLGGGLPAVRQSKTIEVKTYGKLFFYDPTGFLYHCRRIHRHGHIHGFGSVQSIYQEKEEKETGITNTRRHGHLPCRFCPIGGNQ
jgi:hypothetical protein